MTPWRIAALLACLATPAIHALETNGWGVAVNVSSDVRSADVSRGVVCRAHPINTLSAEGKILLGPFGHLCGRAFFLNALTDHKSEVHRLAFYEGDPYVLYGYDWKLGEGWTLKTDAGIGWIVMYGRKGAYRDSVHTLRDWRLLQSLENPYVTPYHVVRRNVKPSGDLIVHFGLRRGFRLVETLAFTPFVGMEFGDTRLQRKKFAAGPEDPVWNRGFNMMTLLPGVSLTWQAMEHVSFFASVYQYTLLSNALRERISDKPGGKTDLTVGSVGVKMSF